MHLDYVDHRTDPAAWATQLGISTEAVEVHLASDVIDLHVDSFIWTRVFGYDLRKRHGRGLLGARYYSHVDFPRALEAGMTGAIWSITTSPIRTARGRARAFRDNLAQLRHILQSVDDQFALVRTAAEYRAARDIGKHGAFIGIQGGNALDADADALDAIEDDSVVRITLVHLSNSTLGESSSPARLRRGDGLSTRGREYVERLDARRIFVDLAHISERGFADAVEVHDPSLPLIATHTGASGAHRSWRNLDDDQLRLIADSGGVIGVIFHGGFLGDTYFHGGSAERIVEHLAHIIDVVGEDHAAIGSDYDGAIIPPRDLATCLELPRLTQHMLDRGWSAERIHKVLGGNFLRALALLRG